MCPNCNFVKGNDDGDVDFEETNAIEGMTHFVLFATFIMLSLIGL